MTQTMNRLTGICEQAAVQTWPDASQKSNFDHVLRSFSMSKPSTRPEAEVTMNCQVGSSVQFGEQVMKYLDLLVAWKAIIQAVLSDIVHQHGNSSLQPSGTPCPVRRSELRFSF